MPKKEKIVTELVPWPSDIVSPGVKCGNIVTVSGQVGGAIGGAYPNDVKAQVKLAIEKVKAILEAGGASLDSVVMCQNYLKHNDDFSAMNEVYTEYFGKMKVPPSRTTVTVDFSDPQILFEINVMAIID
ncbi:MAG: RidA family protein [Oscillospiraceae bacterium]|nr:RidA family protein [Oscillospiraceae bacterium]